MSSVTETEHLIFLRQEICRIGRSLFERGYVHGSTGNISVRVPQADGGGFLITPTDACLGFLDSARLSRIDANRSVATVRVKRWYCIGVFMIAIRRRAAWCTRILPGWWI